MSGTFATIEKLKTDTGVVACKKYNKHHGKLVQVHFQRELWALKQLKQQQHANVIYLLETRETTTEYQLIFPFYATNLQHIHDGKQLADTFIQQLLDGLEHIHKHGIVHCDLSPSNILMEKDTFVICDFGCAQSNQVELEKNNELGTRYYKAPEHLFGYRRYSAATDIWSLGVIFLQLLIGYPVFDGQSDIEQIGRIKFRLGAPSQQVQQEMSIYPDFNKLMYFTCDPEDIEDLEEDAMRWPLFLVLDKEKISTKHQKIILNTLTWSIQNRFSIDAIRELL